ncbi:MAG: cyclic pyranopterin monophosphate synthase MoaC [Rhodospirillaceae bacterium]|nr:cyclic pyranopterin monophosphate synthase MoaC [Rhodospirillaceae bacterium]
MLTHVGEANRPSMVDVGDKAVTTRIARARAVVTFPENVLGGENDPLQTRKGPVVDTAIVAGVLAAKQTHHLIPFCHPIPLEDCSIEVDWNEAGELVIDCKVRATHKTGVEMEALTGAAAAALTVYDMCKSLSHGIRIRDVRLVAKTGGKSDFNAGE